MTVWVDPQRSAELAAATGLQLQPEGLQVLHVGRLRVRVRLTLTLTLTLTPTLTLTLTLALALTLILTCDGLRIALSAHTIEITRMATPVFERPSTETWSG